MSELEENFWKRAEIALDGVEKSKQWYRNAAMAFSISFIVCVFGGGAVGYKIGLMEKDVKGKASIDSVKLLKESNENLTSAIIGLIENKDHQAVANEFAERYRTMNDNIFYYTTTRGGVPNEKKNN